MFKLRNLTVSKRLVGLVSFAMLAMLVLAGVLMVSERSLLMQERKAGVQQAVETAYGVITHFHDLAGKGAMTEEQAKKSAVETLRGLRYNKTEYFWINDMNQIIVLHISADLEGKDLTSKKDLNGKALFVEFVNVVKQSGAGFVDYLWPKPGSADPVPKVSYVKGFAPWGWVLGSGVYVDTVQATFIARVGESALIVLVLALLLGVIGFAISRSILRQLGGEPTLLNSVTQQIAQGNLMVEIPATAEGSVMRGIDSMRASVEDIVKRVREGSENVATASAEIAQGNHDLSSRTEQQASALEETAASMEQLGSTVRQNADSARQANQLATSASGVAQQGGEMVAEVVATMKGIDESSRKISDIIGVIDGIAFQTNILALNAAVEAARAGEQGRGFAVVATEVRSLAGRSAAAAKEIKALIEASVERVEQGNHQVVKAGETMNEVVAAIKRLTDIVAEISAASNEQHSGVVQVGEAVTNMDQATQQNAALVEQMAAAASSLHTQADDLVQAVAVFRLAGGHTAARAPVAKPAQVRPQAPAFTPQAQQQTRIAAKPANVVKPTLKPPSAPAARPAKAPAGAQDDWESF